MIGTHTLIGKNLQIEINQLNFLKLESWFQVNQIEASDSVSMFITHYYGYPYTVFTDDMWAITVEGMVYNLSNEEIKLKCELIANKFINDDNYIDEIKEFTCFCDGEFIIQIYDKKSSRYLVFNNYLGRLPLYYSNANNNLIISRSIKTHLEFMPKIELDLTGIAEFLMFGFTLGDKTYFKNIHRLEPSQAIIIEDFNKLNNYRLINTYKISYNRKSVRINREVILDKLSKQFLNDTKNRVTKLRENGYEIISDLSGGFDSRALIGALSKFDKKIKYFTYEYIQDESLEANKIFNELGKPGTYIKLKFDNMLDEHSITDLVYKTDGLVDYITTSICYNDAVSLLKYTKRKDKIAHFGGFGGEFIRHPQRRYFKSIFYGIENGLYSTLKIEKIIETLNSSTTILAEIRDYFISKYSGNTDEQLRKFYYEYYLHHVGHAGEERTRIFNWTVHPMWSKDFIKLIFEEVPLKWTGYKFFIDFMNQIDCKLLNVAIYNKEINLNSEKSIINYEKKNKSQLGIKAKIYHTANYYIPLIVNLYEKINSKITENGKTDNEIYSTFLKYYNKLEKLKSIFNLKEIQENINSLGRKYNRLTTLVIYLSEIERRYPDKIGEIKN
ncbi:MAG: hypothetical protein IPM14_04055 [bacterium]|nr:hypothetical protein [bacterium]